MKKKRVISKRDRELDKRVKRLELLVRGAKDRPNVKTQVFGADRNERTDEGFDVDRIANIKPKKAAQLCLKCFKEFKGGRTADSEIRRIRVYFERGTIWDPRYHYDLLDVPNEYFGPEYHDQWIRYFKSLLIAFKKMEKAKAEYKYNAEKPFNHTTNPKYYPELLDEMSSRKLTFSDGNSMIY